METKVNKIRKKICNITEKTLSIGLGNPSDDLDITIVFGEPNIGLFLQKIFQESNLKTAILSAEKTEINESVKYSQDFYEKPGFTGICSFLRRAKKHAVDHVILVLNQDWAKKASIVSPQAVIIGNAFALDFKSIDIVKRWNNKNLYQVIFSSDDINYLSYKEIFDKVNQISYGTNDNSDVKINKTKFYKKGMEVFLKIDNQTSLELASYLNRQQDVYSLVAAVSASYVAGIKLKDIVEGVASLGE